MSEVRQAQRLLVTGAAGFIGFHLCRRLLGEGRFVAGLDCVNNYYDPGLKEARLNELEGMPGWIFHRERLEDAATVNELVAQGRFDAVVNLAAQAGVRYSILDPQAYVQSNLVGFVNVLEAVRHHGVPHLVYASSSSVYGLNTKQPFSTRDNVDHPVSLYGATKKANELMAHAYSHLYGVPTTALRFFTVYGPWGRPDMAPILFTKAILEGRPIDVYNFGNMKRDFTYIDDVVEGLLRVIDRPASVNPEWSGESPDPGTSRAPYRVYNIGNHSPVELMRFIEVLEDALGRKAQKNLLPLQPGDVLETSADVGDLMRDVGFKPDTPLEVGVARFVEWYREYYR